MRAMLTTILLVFLTLACTSSGFNGPSKKVGDGRRPSEGGEGVGGYLRDPNDVRYERTDNKVIVAGDAGAIVSDTGTVEGLEVCLIGVSEDLLKQVLAQDRSLSGEGVKVIAKSNSAVDGSFKITGDISELSSGDFITLDVTGFCATERVLLKNASKSIVFKNPNNDGGFSEASSFEELSEKESSAVSDGTIFCAETAECEKQLNLKIIGSDTGEALLDVRIEAFPSDCSADSVANKKCDKLDKISLEEPREIGIASGEYLFKISCFGYETKILDSPKDLLDTIILQAL